MNTIQVNLQSPYPIFIEDGLLQTSLIAEFIRDFAYHFVIISDNNICDTFAKYLHVNLLQNNMHSYLLSMPAGEINKTREVKQQLEDELLKAKCGRDTCIIAVGGGVVTDMAGFIAATYCRGVPIVYVPTSLLAMVDASIGGKTAVNTPYGKNLIGTFSQPRAVFIDPDTLQSLPSAEWHNGIAEIIKHALIADAEMFHSLQNNYEKFINGEDSYLNYLILRSCEIKKDIVEQDEKESGMRQLLNFGHTIGHAIENIEEYQIGHGEAVAIGIVVESYIAKLCGYLSEQDFEAITDIFPLYQLPMVTKAFHDLEKFKQALILDKKTTANNVRFVLLDNIASPHKEGELFSTTVTSDILESALHWAQQKFNSPFLLPDSFPSP